MFSGKKEVKWCPNYVAVLGLAFLVVLAVVIFLATVFPVPDDAPANIPLPDNGEYVPGPEWVFLFFWTPFWYLKGRMKKYLVFMTVIPIIGFLVLIFLPYMHKLKLDRIPGVDKLAAKAKGMEAGFRKSLYYAIPALIFAVVLGGGFVMTGYQAKLLGCDSCHNPGMGFRMAVPPIDIVEYYKVDRARQIDVGKYRAGKTEVGSDTTKLHSGETEGGYKDANWQMRHMYEPTFTW